jgi:UDP:flavonoid glycosyltransferase YjiC (YdhE family)
MCMARQRQNGAICSPQRALPAKIAGLRIRRSRAPPLPAVSVPVIGDQPFWAVRLAGLGAGPRPIPYKRLSARGLAAAIRDAISRPSYQTWARALAGRLAGEDGAAPIVDMLHLLSN